MLISTWGILGVTVLSDSVAAKAKAFKFCWEARLVIIDIAVCIVVCCLGLVRVCCFGWTDGANHTFRG